MQGSVKGGEQDASGGNLVALVMAHPCYHHEQELDVCFPGRGQISFACYPAGALALECMKMFLPLVFNACATFELLNEPPTHQPNSDWLAPARCQLV
jgi:hypothetical protein